MAKILIVSADFNFATLLEARLLMSGHEVFIAGDGSLGLEKARDLEPKLIILDAALPKMSGYQLVEKLKDPDDSLRQIPIIVVADRAPMEYLFRGADIFHFCSKPVIPAQFLKQVTAAIQGVHAPQAYEEKSQKNAEGKKRVLLAGVQEFIVGKIQKFLEQKGFFVDIGWDEDDLVQKTLRTKPDYVFVQFWEELSVLNTPRIMKKLTQDASVRSIPVYAFCAQNIYRDAMLLMPRTRMITYCESQDLLAEIERVLGSGPAPTDGKQVAV